MKMEVQETVPVAFGNSGMATRTAPLGMTPARFLGLDAGDWSMIFVGLALSGVVLAFV